MSEKTAPPRKPRPRRPLPRITRRRVLGAGVVVLAAVGGGVGIVTLTPPDPLTYYNAALPYRLEDVRQGAAVPRVFIPRLNPPLAGIEDENRRKDVFLRILLPLVLAANERRAPVRRIPVAMALAQGAIESGWGTARFSIEGNAIFGQRTWDKDVPGVAPRDAGGDFRVQAFDSLMASVEGYMQNLNTHPKYATFREARKNLLAAGQTPTARALLPHITAYSEEGRTYIAKVMATIGENRLTDFAAARLK